MIKLKFQFIFVSLHYFSLYIIPSYIHSFPFYFPSFSFYFTFSVSMFIPSSILRLSLPEENNCHEISTDEDCKKMNRKSAFGLRNCGTCSVYSIHNPANGSPSSYFKALRYSFGPRTDFPNCLVVSWAFLSLYRRTLRVSCFSPHYVTTCSRYHLNYALEKPSLNNLRIK